VEVVDLGEIMVKNKVEGVHVFEVTGVSLDE
jgi:hypothetical protein